MATDTKDEAVVAPKVESGPSSGDDDEDGKGTEQLEVDQSIPVLPRVEDEISKLARAFFHATTKPSQDMEDILPQEDSADMKLSVFNVFASIFPDVVGENGASAKNKRTRLRFNRIGYQIYGKEQSRRVPAVRAKPGNPGYGFRRARWREPLNDDTDGLHCEKVLKEAGCSVERIEQVKEKIQSACKVWDTVRRPSRPAGPGRPRRPESTTSHVAEARSEEHRGRAWQDLVRASGAGALDIGPAAQSSGQEGSGASTLDKESDPDGTTSAEVLASGVARGPVVMSDEGLNEDRTAESGERALGKRKRKDAVVGDGMHNEGERARAEVGAAGPGTGVDRLYKSSPHAVKQTMSDIGKLAPLTLPPLEFSLSPSHSPPIRPDGAGETIPPLPTAKRQRAVTGPLPSLRQLSGLESLASAASLLERSDRQTGQSKQAQ